MHDTSRLWAMLAKPLPRPNKDWARRIMDDPRATELQKRMANEALLPRIGRHESKQVEDDEQPF